jgi:hypothetical protein
MANTITFRGYRDVWGTRYVRKVSITIVDNYVTGGWPFTAQDFGFGRTSTIEDLILTNPAATAGYVAWDQQNSKLFARDWAGAQLANASAVLAASVFDALVLATGQQG